MLRIRTEIRSSQIVGAGMGLYCVEPVAKGTLIWQFDDGLDIRLPKLPDQPIARDFVSTYGYLQADGVVGYVICMDNARFINHAELEDATCVVERDGNTFAAADLPAGTELTHSYDSFCADDPATGYRVGDGAFPAGGHGLGNSWKTVDPDTGRTWVHFGRSMLLDSALRGLPPAPPPAPPRWFLVRLVRDIVRGIGHLPGYGRHPGTRMLAILVAMGALAGAKDGSLLKAVLGMAAMLLCIGPIYLAGAWSRTRDYDRTLAAKPQAWKRG